jgi:putative ABC transport system ATP-binding protein
MTQKSLISATAIHRTFGVPPLETHVLRGIDLTIYEGEFVAIMGKSGAGKSTLLYQLSVLDLPSSGTVEIDGTVTTALTENERTEFRLRTLGYVFQDYALVPDLTARENIMVPLLMRGESWARARTLAEDALLSVDLPRAADKLPGQLSGGEQQRVAIARAIAGTPKILFADEPTANLDSVSGTTVINLLGDLHERGQTVVMVTHEPEYTMHCNRIIEMQDGEITGDRRP